jgi:hypothetical protein
MTQGAIPKFEEYDVVRVVKLLVPDRHVDGTTGVTRSPQIGDTGTVLVRYPGHRHYEVECVDAEGNIVWLATFSANELELI